MDNNETSSEKNGDKNIVEVYKILKGQLIIMLTGLPGSNRKGHIEGLISLFKLKEIDIKNYVSEDKTENISLPSGKVIKNYDSISIYNWDKINEDVDKYKKDGVLLWGIVIPDENLKFKPDFHIHIKISFKKYITNRHAFLKKRANDSDSDNNSDNNDNILYNIIDTPDEKYLLENIISINYYENLKKSTIQKFFNANEKTFDEIDQEIFDYLITKIDEYVHLN